MAENKIITSRYVQIDQTPAGIGERIFARILDYLTMAVYLLGMYFFFRYTDFNLNGDTGIFWTFVLSVPIIFYSFLWEMFNRGRSPGKMAFGMRVVMCDGAPPTIRSYLLRWMLLLIDTTSWMGVVFILWTKNNQRLGDLAAGTMVIKERDYHRIHVSLDEYNFLSRGYKPVFPQAENLSLEQVNTINEALTRYDANRARRISVLTAKVKEYLKIAPAVDDEAFLKTLIKDFQYYAMEGV